MPYNIFRSDGTPVTIPDNAIDTAYYDPSGGGGSGGAGNGLGIQQIGKNTSGYGGAIAQNFLQLQESFSSKTVPSDATSLQGQLWFNQASTSAGSLYVKTSTIGVGIANWTQLAVVTGTVNFATNLAGGSAGELPYQSSTSTTAFIPAGSPGFVLVANGLGSPNWLTGLDLTVGASENLFGGAAGNISYQTGASTS